eukprot:1142139-Pelagomonas_calceolata.AAC.4
MAERTGVPPEKQRYWAWGPRPNNTLRAVRTLTPEEETSKLLDLKDLREMEAKHVVRLRAPGLEDVKRDTNHFLLVQNHAKKLLQLQRVSPATFRHLGA